MKYRKSLCVFLIVMLLTGLMSGCSLFEKDYPVTVGDVTVNSLPQSVACLSEGAASAVSALGYKSYLTGAPAEFIGDDTETTLVDVGNATKPNEEAIFTLAPDVLITPLQLNSSFADELELRGITVIVLTTPTQYSDIAPYYGELARLFLGKKKSEETAEIYIGELERNLDELKTQNASLTKKAVVFIEDDFVATGDTLAGQALERAGIVNIAADATGYIMNAADIAAANPDVIFCTQGDGEAVLQNAAYKEVTAVQNGAVYEIDTVPLVFAGEGFYAVLHDMSNYLKQ